MLNNTDEFWWFCKERESIRNKRELGKPKPWTQNAILDRHKFTNIDRAHDRGTRLLWDLIRNFTDEKLVYAILLYRFSGSLNAHIDLMSKGSWTDWINELPKSKLFINTKAYQANWPNGKGKGIQFLTEILPNYSKDVTEFFLSSEHQYSISNASDHMCDILANYEYKRMSFQATESAKDIAHFRPNWINPDSMCKLGPGAIKGIKYIWPMCRNVYEAFNKLRALPENPGYNLSVLEHGLCEFSKYKDYQNGTRKEGNGLYKGIKG